MHVPVRHKSHISSNLHSTALANKHPIAVNMNIMLQKEECCPCQGRDPTRKFVGCRFSLMFMVRQRQCTCPENSDLAEAFDELAGLYFKEQSKAGFVYKKARLVLYTLAPSFFAARAFRGLNQPSKCAVVAAQSSVSKINQPPAQAIVSKMHQPRKRSLLAAGFVPSIGKVRKPSVVAAAFYLLLN